MITEFVQRQREFKHRAKLAMRGRMFWSSSKHLGKTVLNTYDPYGKLQIAWNEWDARRKIRNATRT